MPPEQAPDDKIYNESHWTDPYHKSVEHSFYTQGKTLAEKAAWDFQATLSDEQKFDVVTILPGFVVGPPIRKVDFYSGRWLIKLMQESDGSGLNDSMMGVVDVRDVAKAHL